MIFDCVVTVPVVPGICVDVVDISSAVVSYLVYIEDMIPVVVCVVTSIDVAGKLVVVTGSKTVQ